MEYALTYLLYYHTKNPVTLRVHLAVRTDLAYPSVAAILRDPDLRRGSRGQLIVGMRAISLCEASDAILSAAEDLVIRAASEHASGARAAHPMRGKRDRGYVRRRARVAKGGAISDSFAKATR